MEIRGSSLWRCILIQVKASSIHFPQAGFLLPGLCSHPYFISPLASFPVPILFAKNSQNTKESSFIRNREDISLAFIAQMQHFIPCFRPVGLNVTFSLQQKSLMGKNIWSCSSSQYKHDKIISLLQGLCLPLSLICILVRLVARTK